MDHAIVLRKRGVGEGAEGGGDHAAHPIAEHAALEPAYIRRAADGLAGNHAIGGEIADGFDAADQINQRNRQEGAPVEVETKAEWCRQADQWQVRQSLGSQFAAEPRREAAQGQADDDGRQAYPGRVRAVEQDDRQNHEQAQRQVGGGAEVRCIETAAEVGDAHFDQADADQRNHNAGHQRCDHAAQLADKAAQYNLYRRAEEAHAENHRQNVFRAAAALFHQKACRQHRAEKRKAGALQADHAGTDAKRPACLDEGAYAGNHQRHADQVGQVGGEAEGGANNQRRRDDADERRQYMLQRREESGQWFRPVVEAVDQVAGAGGFWGHGGSTQGERFKVLELLQKAVQVLSFLCNARFSGWRPGFRGNFPAPNEGDGPCA